MNNHATEQLQRSRHFNLEDLRQLEPVPPDRDLPDATMSLHSIIDNSYAYNIDNVKYTPWNVVQLYVHTPFFQCGQLVVARCLSWRFSVLLHLIHCQLETAGCLVAVAIQLAIAHILGAIDCPQPVITALVSLLELLTHTCVQHSASRYTRISVLRLHVE